jgi:hypothetical protein
MFKDFLAYFAVPRKADGRDLVSIMGIFKSIHALARHSVPQLDRAILAAGGIHFGIHGKSLEKNELLRNNSYLNLNILDGSDLVCVLVVGEAAYIALARVCIVDPQNWMSGADQ